MPFWSPQNAQTAYLQALRMRSRGREPDIPEFISALAAGKNAKLIVIIATNPNSTMLLPLAVAAHQTGGHVVCICSEISDLEATKKPLKDHNYYEHCVEFVVGDAKTLLLGDYKGADFVVVDCNIYNPKEVLQAALIKGSKHDGGEIIVVGYNVNHNHRELCLWRQLKTSFLPIGDGLLLLTNKLDHQKNGKVCREVTGKTRKILTPRHAFSMPNAPSMALFVTTSSASFPSKSIGVATWKTPLQPSMASLKLSGLFKSAFTI
ncbi:DUF1442 family protein [Senna tora]|uniref:DUF1442 family protein n=1 Tax=Senna tora TaxID=362788 RepID=A0A834TQC6_9FABA|nr:DUF1442 family protein [Senna tora]